MASAMARSHIIRHNYGVPNAGKEARGGSNLIFTSCENRYTVHHCLLVLFAICAVRVGKGVLFCRMAKKPIFLTFCGQMGKTVFHSSQRPHSSSASAARRTSRNGGLLALTIQGPCEPQGSKPVRVCAGPLPSHLTMWTGASLKRVGEFGDGGGGRAAPGPIRRLQTWKKQKGTPAPTYRATPNVRMGMVRSTIATTK